MPIHHRYAHADAAADYRGALCVFGGDTLQCVLRALGGHTLRPICEAEAGVVISRLSDRRILVSKSGSFGSPDVLDGLQRRGGAAALT